MLKMSFRRVSPEISGYSYYPHVPGERVFRVDVIEGGISPFIIYGDDNKSEFKRFNDYHELNGFVSNLLSDKCAENDTLFEPQSQYRLFVNLTPKEFKQHYLSKSWLYNFIGEYICYHDANIFLNDVQIDYLAIKDFSDSMAKYLGDEEIKRNPSIFDNLSDTDKNDLNDLLNEFYVEQSSSVKSCDIIKAYSKHPFFGMF